MRQIEERLCSAAADYFMGMTDDYTNASIREIISSVKSEEGTAGKPNAPESITIYKEELEKIEALGHDDTERLAFAFLCAAKMIPYSQIYECNAELYRLAWRYRYDATSKTVVERVDRRRVGNDEATKRVNRICQAGIVQYSTRINSSHKRTGNKPTAAAVFAVPIICDSGEVAFKIDRPDEGSLVLYYDRYKGYGGIMTCADDIKHHPEKRNLCLKIEA